MSRCPHLIFSVNSVMPQALSESPGIDPREACSRNTEGSRKKRTARGMWPEFTPGCSICGFSLGHFHSLWIQKKSQDEHGKFATFFFFLMEGITNGNSLFLTSIDHILPTQAGAPWEATHSVESGFPLKARLGLSRLPANIHSDSGSGKRADRESCGDSAKMKMQSSCTELNRVSQPARQPGHLINTFYR